LYDLCTRSSQALFNNGDIWYRGKIATSQGVKASNRKYNILFDDGDRESGLPGSKLRWWGEAERERRAQGKDFLEGAMPFNGWKRQQPMSNLIERIMSMSGGATIEIRL